VGQRIKVEASVVVNDSIVITTDRNLTVADGEGYSSADEAATATTFGARLAADLFESDDAITRVYVAANVVVLQRAGGWSDDANLQANSVIETFFLYY